MRSFVRLAVLLLVGMVWLPGCGERKEADSRKKPNRPPAVKNVAISPGRPVAGQPLTASAQAGDPDGDPVQLTFRWEINDEEVAGEERSQLPGEGLKPGDRVVVWAIPYDGKTEGEAVSSPVMEISGAPPREIRVELTPVDPAPGDSLTAHATVPGPQREDLRFRYLWRVNGEPVEGASGSELATERLRRGDRVEVEVTPEADGEQGPSGVSPEVVLQNRPPKIVSNPPGRLAPGGRYRYPVKAVDPDGDPLEFRLEGIAPPGMRIDPATGVVEWTAPQRLEEPVVVDIRVSDGQGGEAEQRYDFQISEPGQSQ